MKHCPDCKSPMEQKSKIITVNTAGTVVISGSSYPQILSSSASDHNSGIRLGVPFTKVYWLCTNDDCKSIQDN